MTSTASTTALQHLMDSELSLRPRIAHVLLLLASLCMTAVVVSLWATEPVLPLRTQIAFAVMTVIGFSWASYALWVLTYRRVLFAGHRILAGRMAVTFTAVFALGALLLGVTVGGTAPFAAAGLGLVMVGVAVVLLRQAHVAFARLTERRQALERELGGRPLR